MQSFDFDKAAVISVDLQRDYLPGARWAVAGYPRVLERAAAILGAARNRGLAVVHLQAWKAPEAGMGPASQDPILDPREACGMAGSPGAEICAEVAPQPGELVVRKPLSSGFRQTDLDAALRQRGITHLIVFGVWSDMCVRGTVLDGMEAGYRVWLAKDACGSGTETMHRVAVLDMANRLYGGRISATAELLKALEGEAHRAWVCEGPVPFYFTAESIAGDYAGL